MTTTASVYFNKINVDYPRAGKDNDSQGFRDNFRNIFNAFSATNADVEYLKLNSVTLGGDNDFGYNVIKKATFQSSVTKIVDYSPNPTNGNIFVNYLESNYQKYSLNAGASTFFIQNWPADGFAEMRLVVTPASTATCQINFGGNLKIAGSLVLPVVTNTTDDQTFDLWSDDGGVTVYIQGVGITPAVLVKNSTGTVYTGTLTVSVLDGPYQKFSLNTGSVNVSVSNWPASTNTLALITLSLNRSTTETIHTSTVNFTSNGVNALPVGSQSQPFSISTSTTQFFDVWTDNGGATVYVLQKGI